MTYIQQFIQFLKDVRVEADRVQWPEARQTLITTGVVLVFVAITSAYLAGADFLISRLVEAMLK